MEIIKINEDINILLNQEQHYQTNAGWQDNMTQFQDEVLSQILNPAINYETVRYINKPYTSTNNINQTDIWFYFYFVNGSSTYTNGLDYNLVGIPTLDNARMTHNTEKSFFRLEFYKTPTTVSLSGTTLTCEAPTRTNRKLVFAKNLMLPSGEKYYYTPLQENIHVPVFTGSNYRNKENMYFFWFQDESALSETNFSGTTTGNTFFMTAKFFNANDGTILDFTNDKFVSGHTLSDSNDFYYQVDIDKRDYSYQVYKFNGTKGIRVGGSNTPINFYEKGGHI